METKQKTAKHSEKNTEALPIRQHTLLFIIWSVVFGVAFATVGSVLAGMLPPDPITRTLWLGWYVAVFLAINKMLIQRPFSVTFMVTIAATISIFTFFYGPPNPFKFLYIFAGLAYDFGTGFKTKKITWLNLITGFTLYVFVVFGVFIFTLYIVDPQAALPIIPLVKYGILLFLAIGIPITVITWKMFHDRVKKGKLSSISRMVSPESK